MMLLVSSISLLLFFTFSNAQRDSRDEDDMNTAAYLTVISLGNLSSKFEGRRLFRPPFGPPPPSSRFPPPSSSGLPFPPPPPSSRFPSPPSPPSQFPFPPPSSNLPFPHPPFSPFDHPFPRPPFTPSMNDECSEWGEWESAKCWWPNQNISSLPSSCTYVPTKKQWPDYVKNYVKAKAMEMYNMIVDEYTRRGSPPQCGHCPRTIQCRIRNETEEGKKRGRRSFCPLKEVRAVEDSCGDSRVCVVTEEKGGCPPPLFLNAERINRLRGMMKMGKDQEFAEQLFKMRRFKDDSADNEGQRDKRDTESEMIEDEEEFMVMDGVLYDPTEGNDMDRDGDMRRRPQGGRKEGRRGEGGPFGMRGGPAGRGPGGRGPEGRGPGGRGRMRPFGPDRGDRGEESSNEGRRPPGMDSDRRGPFNGPPMGMGKGPMVRREEFESSDMMKMMDRRFADITRRSPFPFNRRQMAFNDFDFTFNRRRGGGRGPRRHGKMIDFLSELVHGTSCASTGSECVCCCGSHIPNVETGECEDIRGIFPGVDDVLNRMAASNSQEEPRKPSMKWMMMRKKNKSSNESKEDEQPAEEQQDQADQPTQQRENPFWYTK